jgi:transposase
LRLLRVTRTDDGVLVEAAGQDSARCPACGRRSRARHSRYTRTLKDLAAQGAAVTLRLQVSRWRCRRAQCDTQVFTERLAEVCGRHARQTRRLGDILHLVGYALGGRGGERLLGRLGMAVSDDTILRVLKQRARAVPSGADALQIVGIDDWAWRKGHHHFGTIMVDLERSRVVEVLPARTADSLARWLAARPAITVISRDRHGPYADGVRRGAPQAKEVADRFHLMLNLRTAVEKELSGLRRFLVVPKGAGTRSGEGPASTPAGRPRSAAIVQPQWRAQERRARQHERVQRVKQLQAAGRTGQAIMRETGIGRNSVRTWWRLSERPPRKRIAPRPGMPAFYHDYLQQRWTEGCRSGRLLMAEIQALGYVGRYAGLAKILAPWRAPAPGDAPRPVPVRHLAPPTAAALLSQPRALLNARQAATVDRLKAQCPGFPVMRRLVLSFRTILRHGKVATLHRWMTQAHDSPIRPLQQFVKTLRRDLAAVEGAVTEPWSTGPVEGHINRLKTLRRQMYGRAGVELLRARVIPLEECRPARAA